MPPASRHSGATDHSIRSARWAVPTASSNGPAFLPSVTGHIGVGFVWQGGAMTPLPTLGGNQGFATSVNSAGQVVGWAETPVLDPTCNLPQRLQFRAVLWDTKARTTKELRP